MQCISIPNFSHQQNSEGKLPEVASSVVLVNTIIEGGIKIGSDSVVYNSHLQVIT